MAGSYPNIPGERIAHELDSRILLQRSFSGTAWTSYSTAEKIVLNKEKYVDRYLDTAYYFQVIFPVPYDIYGVFAVQAYSYGFNWAGPVLVSTDTTNGSDGTWTTVMTNLYGSSEVYSFGSSSYRTKIKNITGATGIKGIRFTSTATGLNNEYIWISNFHIYGSKSSTSNRIEFWNSSNTAELLPQDWDFGDTVEGSTEIKEFKVKNYLGVGINKLVLQVDVPSDETISIFDQYKISTDQLNWTSNLVIPSVPGQTIADGSVSETIYLKRSDTELHASGLFTGRVEAYIEEFDRGYWTINGNASYNSYNLNLTDQVQLVPGSTGNAGTMWYNKTMSLPLSLNFSYTLSNSNAAIGADGLTIAFKDKDTPLDAIGTSGGNLAIYNINNRATGVIIDCFANTGERSAPYLSSFDTHNNPMPGQTNTTTLTTAEINGTHTVSVSITESLATVSIDGVQKWTSTDLPKMLPTEFIMGFTSSGGTNTSRWTISPTSLTYGTYSGTAPSQVTSGALLNYDFSNPACYPGSGNTITDLSGNNNTGTMYNGVAYSSKYGGVLQFDGTTGYISLPSTSFSNFTSGISVAFVANFGGNALDGKRLLDFSSAASGASANNIMIYRSAGSAATLGFAFYSAGAATAFIEDTKNYIPENQMSHYVLVHNGTNFLVYRNGILVATKASAVLPVNQTRTGCYIGRNFDGGQNLDGEISTLKIFNRALSAAEALQDFQAVRSRYKL